MLLATVGVRPASRLGGDCAAEPEGGFSARQPAGLAPSPARCLAVARILVPHDELSSIDTNQSTWRNRPLSSIRRTSTANDIWWQIDGDDGQQKPERHQLHAFEHRRFTIATEQHEGKRGRAKDDDV